MHGPSTNLLYTCLSDTFTSINCCCLAWLNDCHSLHPQHIACAQGCQVVFVVSNCLKHQQDSIYTSRQHRGYALFQVLTQGHAAVQWPLLYCCCAGGSAADLAAPDRAVLDPGGPLQTQLTGGFKLAAVVVLLLKLWRELT
jgi:hypothetical protein